MAISYANIAGQEPSTVTFRVGTVVIQRGSTNEQQEILVLGDPQTSNALARVVASAPASSEYGLIVRPVDGHKVDQNSTVWATQSAQAGNWTVRATLSSTGTDNPVSAAQASTVWAVQLSQYSTVAAISSVSGKVAVVNSSAGDLNVTVAGYSTTVNVSSLGGKVAVVNSSAGDLNVTVAGYSTIAAVSSVGGIVTVRPSDTNWASSAGFHFDSSGALQIAGTFNATTSTVVTVSQLLDSSGGSVTAADSANNAIRVNVVAGAAGGSTIVTVSTGSVRVHQSSAADLNVTVAGYSTIVSVAALPSGLISTVAGSSGSSGLLVRPIHDVIQTVASSNACASTSLSIQSSAANIRSYVTAYSMTSTAAGPVKLAFYSGSTMIWPVVLAAVSSAISGVNLAVGGPNAYLFRTKASGPLTLQTPSSVAGVKVGVSYYRAP